MLVDILTVLAPVLSATAGGLVGFLSARAMWRVQERERRRNIAVGFLLEMESLEKMLTGYANMFSGPGLFRVDTPIYPSTGLYRVMQREIFSFDAPLSRSLFQFYSRVLEAEQLRSMDPKDPRYRIMQEGAGLGLKAAIEQLPSLRAALTAESGASQSVAARGA